MQGEYQFQTATPKNGRRSLSDFVQSTVNRFTVANHCYLTDSRKVSKHLRRDPSHILTTRSGWLQLWTASTGTFPGEFFPPFNYLERQLPWKHCVPLLRNGTTITTHCFLTQVPATALSWSVYELFKYILDFSSSTTPT